MDTNSITPMACGNCGHGLFRMFLQQIGNGFALLSECELCKSVTRIEPKPAELELSFGKGSSGQLAPMKPLAKGALTEASVRDARGLVGTSVLLALQLPDRVHGYRIAAYAQWTHAADYMRCVVDLEDLSVAVGAANRASQGLLVVRFMSAEGDGRTQLQEACLASAGGVRILATVSAADLRPSPERD